MKACVKGLNISNFWKNLTEDEFDSLHASSVPTPDRVLSLLEAEDKNAHEQTITTWLHRFVRETNKLPSLCDFCLELSHSIDRDR